MLTDTGRNIFIRNWVPPARLAVGPLITYSAQTMAFLTFGTCLAAAVFAGTELVYLPRSRRWWYSPPRSAACAGGGITAPAAPAPGDVSAPRPGQAT